MLLIGPLYCFKVLAPLNPHLEQAFVLRSFLAPINPHLEHGFSDLGVDGVWRTVDQWENVVVILHEVVAAIRDLKKRFKFNR